MSIESGFAAGGGNDALESVLRRYLAQQQLQQQAANAAAIEQDRAAQRALQERQIAGQESDRAGIAADRARAISRQEAADKVNAENQRRDDIRARINMLPTGQSFSPEDAADLRGVSPELFQAEEASQPPSQNPPGIQGPNPLTPTGRIRFIGTETAREKDAARKQQEDQQARLFAQQEAQQNRLFEQQKELARIQGANSAAVANINHPNAGPSAQTQQANEINDALDLVKSIEGDPALQYSVGPLDARRPSMLSTDPGGIERFRAAQDRLTGILQLAQAGKIKGQGQVSNNERQLLAKAATSLNQYGNEADYRAELARIRQYFERAAQQGGVSIAPSPSHGVGNDPLGIRRP